MVPDEAVYLVSDRGVTALRGDAVLAVARLLDGTRDVAQVAADAPGGLSEDQVRLLIGRLAENRLLTSVTPGAAERSVQAYWELAGLDGSAAARRAERGEVSVTVVGEADPAGLRAALGAAGLAVRPTDELGPDGLVVVVCDDYLDPALAALDAAQRRSGRPWLMTRLGRADLWLGPVFRPGAGPCWSCLADRLGRNRHAENYLWQELGLRLPAPESAPVPVAAAAEHLTALEAAKWLAGHRHPGQNAVWTLDTTTLTGHHHAVRRRPQCPSCGDRGLRTARAWRPLALRSRPKAADLNGGADRAVAAREMAERYAHLVDPLTGVVKEIRRDPRGPEFLNCFHAGHNPVVAADGPGAVRAGLRSFSSGKGITAEHARVSALCEAVERYSGHYQGDEATVRATYSAVADRAVHPDAVQLFHPRQFADRERWNAEHGPFHRVPEPFDESAEIDWTPVWSLTAGHHRLLPTASLYYNAAHLPGGRFCVADSNGAAAGSSTEDAVVQGTLELVERDSVALWWYNRTRQPAVDLDAFDDAWADSMRRSHTALGRTVWALDLTGDLGIPVFAALSRRTTPGTEDVVMGFGAHFDPRTALRRALTELNQMMPPVIGSRGTGGGYGTDDRAALHWWRTATVATQPYLLPDPGQAARTPDGFPRVARADLRDDVTALTGALRERGLEMLVLDQTLPDIALPVVKVIVPGLRSFRARFAPGRLYDVPRSLGRLDHRRSYADLNPIPLFM
ncbi:TOMM precursor leader peptide-binding protein [Streptomyces sp. S186]|uniref:TOMM precursor leader peptide-binding protein n=1 Tax=Streptomyces sp. S186 TaxID=3434395 RepID=UPI003F6654D9